MFLHSLVMGFLEEVTHKTTHRRYDSPSLPPFLAKQPKSTTQLYRRLPQKEVVYLLQQIPIPGL